MGEKNPNIPASSPEACALGYCSRMALRCRLSLSNQNTKIAKNMLTTTTAMPIAALAPLLMLDGLGELVAALGKTSDVLADGEAIEKIVDAVLEDVPVVMVAKVTPELTELLVSGESAGAGDAEGAVVIAAVDDG